jgi:hypothetical protein
LVLFDLYSKEKSQHHHHRETESQLNSRQHTSESQYFQANFQAIIIQNNT